MKTENFRHSWACKKTCGRASLSAVFKIKKLDNKHMHSVWLNCTFLLMNFLYYPKGCPLLNKITSSPTKLIRNAIANQKYQYRHPPERALY